MTRDASALLIVFLFVVAAILISEWAAHRDDNASIVVLKTRAVDMGEEIAKRRDAFYDRRMDE